MDTPQNFTPISCPFCKQTQIKKNGVVKRKSGESQRYICIDCRKSFSKPITKDTPKIGKRDIPSSAYDDILELILEGKSCEEISLKSGISKSRIYSFKNDVMKAIQEDTETNNQSLLSIITLEDRSVSCLSTCTGCIN